MTADPLAGMYDSEGMPVATRGGGAVAWMSFMGIPQSRDNLDEYASLQALAQAPADEAWVYACVAKRFRAAASVRQRVYVRVGQDLIPNELQPSMAASDLQYLLDTVNPIDMTGTEFRGYTQASRATWGGCGWKKVRGRLSGATRELYWLPAPDLKPYAPNGRVIERWDYTPNRGQAESLKPQDVIIFRSFNMGSHTDFLSPLSAARYDIQTLRGSSMLTAATLRNRGVPEIVWKAAKGVEVTKQDQSAIKRFIRQLRGPQNAGKSLVAPDIEPVELALRPKDAEWVAAGKISRMRVSAVTGVPLLVAGDDDKASVYANYRDADIAFWRGTMVDELNGDADVINSWLTPEFTSPGNQLVVAPDFSNVEALKPTYQDETTAWGSFLDHQAATPNELRKYFRLGPDVSWGDQPIPRTTITIRDTPTTPIAVPALENETSVPVPVPEQGDSSPDAAADGLRAVGRRLYQQLPVKAFVKDGGPLDADSLLGVRVGDETRRQIEDGLTRRHSAEQIASSIEGIVGLRQRAVREMMAVASREDDASEQRLFDLASSMVRTVEDIANRPVNVTVAAPTVTVNPPDVHVTVEPAQVTVPAPQVLMMPAARTRKTPIRDAEGRITEVREEPIGG